MKMKSQEPEAECFIIKLMCLGVRLTRYGGVMIAPCQLGKI